MNGIIPYGDWVGTRDGHGLLNGIHYGDWDGVRDGRGYAAFLVIDE